MQDLRTSILVNSQVPEFVRDEYPKFIKFLEAYYEFLETEQVGQTSDLINIAKDLRYLPDVDESLDRFESGFYNTFLSLLPQDINIDKAMLIKNILPLYQSKGSEKSFELLFMLLFGEEVKIRYPKDQILIASGGNWQQNHVLRVSNEISTEYIGDGVTRDFNLGQLVYSDDILVYIDDVLTTNFITLRESQKIRFDTAPLENQYIVVHYDTFNIDLLNNRRIVGVSSGASSLVEKVISKRLSETPYCEFYINEKTLVGSFVNGEDVLTDVIINGSLINVRLKLISNLSNITIIDGGASYNVGDPVIIRGISTKVASAVVEEVASGNIEDVVVIKGGSGFKVDANVEAVGFTKEFFDAKVQTVDATGVRSSNSITVFTDTIENYANTLLDAIDYGFPNAGTENVNTVIANALSTTTLTNLGEITTVLVTSSLLQADEQINYDFNALSPIVNDDNANNVIRLSSLGIIGSIEITNPGINYEVGDSLVFDYITPDAYGRDAVASISEVSGNGEITRIEITNGGGLHSSVSFPDISVSSVNGSGAVLNVLSVLGDDEYIEGTIGEYLAGQILGIRILDPGAGYLSVPAIDLTGSGNGQATATANSDIQQSYSDNPGKWIDERGLISTENTRLEGRDYYINYSYILNSKVEFSKYKDIFKSFIHPAGMIVYNEYDQEKYVKYQNNSIVVASSLTIESSYWSYGSYIENLTTPLWSYGSYTESTVLL